MGNKKNIGYEEINKIPRNNGRFAQKYDEPMVSIGVRVSKSTVEWLESVAQEKGIRKTELIRDMIQQYKSDAVELESA